MPNGDDPPIVFLLGGLTCLPLRAVLRLNTLGVEDDVRAVLDGGFEECATLADALIEPFPEGSDGLSGQLGWELFF